MTDLKSKTLPELTDFLKSMGQPAFRGKQVFTWLHRGVRSFEEMTNLPKALRDQLAENCVITAPTVARKQVSALDGTRKYLWELSDGNCIETVLMQYHHGNTVCISSQVGCRMGCAFCASTIGGLFSCAVLLFAAPPIASFALKFGPAEYFALALFGLTIIASVGGKSQIKGLLMGFVGLLISCIGIDPMDGVSRFTFGINRMEGGIDTIPVLIGLFAITEIMAKARDMNKATGTAVKVEKEKTRFRDVLKYKMVLLKSSILGVFIGAVPGTGAAISSFLAYNEAKRTSKHPEEYGHGSEEAVVASESANNAVTGATLIPLLTLGIPGDGVTAMLLGAFMIHGLTPGPLLFVELLPCRVSPPAPNCSPSTGSGSTPLCWA